MAPADQKLCILKEKLIRHVPNRVPGLKEYWYGISLKQKLESIKRKLEWPDDESPAVAKALKEIRKEWKPCTKWLKAAKNRTARINGYEKWCKRAAYLTVSKKTHKERFKNDTLQMFMQSLRHVSKTCKVLALDDVNAARKLRVTTAFKKRNMQHRLHVCNPDASITKKVQSMGAVGHRLYVEEFEPASCFGALLGDFQYSSTQKVKDAVQHFLTFANKRCVVSYTLTKRSAWTTDTWCDRKRDMCEWMTLKGFRECVPDGHRRFPTSGAFEQGNAYTHIWMRD